MAPTRGQEPSPLDAARELHRGGQLREALVAYEKVVAAATGSDPAAAATAHNNACLIYVGFAEYDRALRQCQQALELRRGLDDDRRLARTLNNLAIVQQNLGAFDGATSSLNEALEINTRRGDLEAQIFNLSNLGSVATLTGSYGTALEIVGQIERLAVEHPDSSWSRTQLRLAKINRGVVLEKMTAYREALALYQEALALGEDADLRNRAQVHLNLGVVYRNLGDPVTAASQFRAAAALFDEAEDRAGLAQTLINLAHAYHLNLERPSEAEAAYRRAMELAETVSDRPLAIEVTFYLGQYLIDQDQIREAEAILTRCRDLAEASGSREGRWSALAGLGRIEARRGNLEAARELLLAAVGEIEQARSEVMDVTLRERYFGDKRAVFDSAIQILADLDSSQPEAGHDRLAFEVAQRAKARSLLDSLGESGPWLAPLSAAEIETAVATHPILEYYVAERDLLVWVIDQLGLRLINLGPAKSILDSVATLHQRLASGENPTPDQVRTLSIRLLPEFLPANTAAQLRISPDAGLRYLPFEILNDPRTPDRRLIDSLAVTYLPSASVAVAPTTRRGRPRFAAAALARSGLEPEGNSESPPGAFLASRLRLEPLPATTKELDAMMKWLPTPQELRTDSAATEAAYHQIAAGGARVLHLATHTVIDELRGTSTILLQPDGPHDGLLYPFEIAEQAGAVDLTVLAACRTAVDPANEVGALASLTGAFLAGGSSAVVATLWDVGDAVSAIFMEQFYYYLGRGLSTGEALRRSKIRLLQDPRWSAPALWAGYISIGEAVPFPHQRRARGWILALTLAATLIGLAGLLTTESAPES